jgi:hypothetical protein
MSKAAAKPAAKAAAKPAAAKAAGDKPTAAKATGDKPTAPATIKFQTQQVLSGISLCVARKPGSMHHLPREVHGPVC